MAEENKIESLNLKLFGPVASSAGETLQDTWDLVFGGFGTYVEKKRIVRKKALEDFKAALEAKVNDIPSSQLREPPISVIGPALEASKYYFEEEEIRAMFASVISASMDARVNSLVHPSFPAIIQQLSARDAKILECFADNSTQPLCEYHIRHLRSKEAERFPDEAPYTVIYSNVFLADPEIDDLEQAPVSITTLARLGLIDIRYEKAVASADYTAFEKTPEYHQMLSVCKDDPQLRPHIEEGCAILTPLGESLCKICFGARSGYK